MAGRAPDRTTRPYRSALREEQSRRTRAAVLEAAAALFAEQGYSATTMRRIAARAGVSVETVYATGSKSALLLGAVARREQAGLQDVLTEPDPRERLRRLGELVAQDLARSGPVLAAFAAAAGVDPELAPPWAAHEQRRLADATRLVDSLDGALRPGLDPADAVDVVWALLGPETTGLLRRRGWTPRACADWLVDALERLLLP